MTDTPIDPYAEYEDPDGVPTDLSGPDGVDGADDVLEQDRERDADETSDDAADYPAGFGDDDVAAAEQGNRDGDEMVSEGDDAAEVAELSGDTEDIDAIGTDTPGEDQGFRINDELETGISGDLEDGDGDPLAG